MQHQRQEYFACAKAERSFWENESITCCRSSGVRDLKSDCFESAHVPCENRLCAGRFSGSFVLSWQGIEDSVVLAFSCSWRFARVCS